MTRSKSTELASPPPWREAFNRSRLAPHLFVVREHLAWDIHELCGFHDRSHGTYRSPQLTKFGAPWKLSLSHRSNLRIAACFLDGGVIFVEKTYFFGLLGTWIVGSLALRYMCGALGFRQPSSRLDGIVTIPHAALQDLLREQLNTPYANLEGRLQHFDAGDGAGLVRLASACPPETEALLLRLRTRPRLVPRPPILP